VTAPSTTREQVIRDRLSASFTPQTLQVINESSGHAVPKGSETHFKVVVVSEAFEGKAAVVRHKLVYQALGEELRAGLHALSIVSRTPEEWQKDQAIAASPPCEGARKPGHPQSG
jgi:BolA-like protein 1